MMCSGRITFGRITARESQMPKCADGSAIKNGCAESNGGNAVCRNRKDSEIHPKADRETKGRKGHTTYTPEGIIRAYRDYLRECEQLHF